MKKQFGTKIIPVYKWLCDGPSHVEDTEEKILPSGGITITHGYDSSLDGFRQHFCDLKCLKDWLDSNPTYESERARGAEEDLWPGD